jgi:hypothetical protein
MKKQIQNLLRQLPFLLAFIFSVGIYQNIQAQNLIEKENASINLSYKISNGIKSIKAIVERKINGKYFGVENLKLNLYLTEVKAYDASNAEGLLATLSTNADGEVIFNFSPAFYKATANKHDFNFIVNSVENPLFEDLSSEIILNDYAIDLNIAAVDTISSATAKISKYENSELIPAAELELKLAIKKTFGLLPFGEEGTVTDENGEVIADIPADVPGNANHTITIVARYVDEENTGVIEVSKNAAWKILPKLNAIEERTLWSTGHNAPIPLVIVTVSLIAFIWGIIIYLFSLLIKIKKLGNQKNKSKQLN